MSVTFRRAVREQVSLIIVLAGGSGSGKTMTAMKLAAGIAGDKPFAVIDTENGRAKHYADFFRFDHADLRAPFSPMAYTEAIEAADKARYPVIVIDQVSYEHAGDGGLLDWHEAELQRMAGDDYKKREACKMAAWIKPKSAHKKFMQTLLNVNAHLILCLRAEEKVEMKRGDDGKMKIVPKQSLTGKDGWIPICEKNVPYEATCSFLLTPDAPGVPKPIKLQEQHRALFPLDKPITEESGRLVAAWAAGGAKESAPMGAPASAGSTSSPSSLAPPSSAADLITKHQALDLEVLCKDAGVSVTAFLRKAGISELDQLPAADYPDAVAALKSRAEHSGGARA